MDIDNELGCVIFDEIHYKTMQIEEKSGKKLYDVT